MSIFLTETSTRHSLLYKHKHFHDTTQTKLTSNSSKLTGASRGAPIDVDVVDAQDVDNAHVAVDVDDVDGLGQARVPALLREEFSDDDVVALHDIPSMIDSHDESAAGLTAPRRRASKRRRGTRSTPLHAAAAAAATDDDDDSRNSPEGVATISDEEQDRDDGLFVSSDEDEDESTTGRPSTAKRPKDDASAARFEGARDDQETKKKKLAMDISYEGFAIYGRVLCLVVKRRGGAHGAGRKGKGLATTPGATGRSRPGPPAGHAMMENWISSTQMPEAAGP